MNLHHADKADWENQAPDTWNFWQRIAAPTKGIIAPANIVSLIGAGVAFYGIHLMWRGSIIPGIIAVLIGRVADILDGVIADHTKTKSPFGEGFDATIDKIIILLVLEVIYWQGLLPWPVLVALVLSSVYNMLIGFYAGWIKKIKVHPSQSGKLSSVFAWVAILLLILANQLKNDFYADIFKIVGYICFVIFLGGALISSYGYTKMLLKR
jgi:phosphatidylglycerophosphate synthase